MTGLRGACLFYFSRRRKKGNVLSCGFLYEYKEKARAPRKSTVHLNPSPRQSYSACWRMMRALQKKCRAHVVKRHMSNPWHRRRPSPAAPLVVRCRYLIEVPSLLPAVPLVLRRTMLWPLRRCALRILSCGAQADARPAVRARASTVKKECL